MQAASGRICLLLVAGALLAACSDRTPQLMSHSRGDGPDEFTVIPGKPLETPKNYADLPAPTPGGSNLTDATPLIDAAVALGGSATAYSRTGISTADKALVSYAGRYGVQPGIREELSATDLEFRKNNRGRIMLRLVGRDRYYDAYEDLSLDKYQELARLRAAGVKTPSAPPEPDN